LPAAQREIWEHLRPAPGLSLVLYGGTAIALHLGHRTSVDFDFFSSRPLDKPEIRRSFRFMGKAVALQDTVDTLVVSAAMPSGPVKVSFFGGVTIGRLNDPLLSSDDVLLVASLEDLMATKLKAILDRAEAKDYRDIAAMLSAKVSLSVGLAAFAQMFQGEPAIVLRGLGYFGDGDLEEVRQVDRLILRKARDEVRKLPSVVIRPGLLPE